MEDQNFLDSILLEVGEFGKYQKKICFLVVIVTAMTYFGSVIYVFEAKQINHRCKISECESNLTEFKPSWWQNAIPSTDEEPSKCSRYRRRDNSTGTCLPSDFDKEITEPCSDFVYETKDISILQDFGLQCDENIWKLTLVGTIHSAGLFIGLPISGILSDRFGRKTMLICILVSSGIVGIARSFSTSYIMFLVLEILEPMCRAGGYAICYILGVELVGPNKRVLVSLWINTLYATGGVILGGVAWLVQSWRTLLRILYGLYLIVIVYYWLMPESVRWLLARKRFTEAQAILLEVAKVNGRTISEESLKKLESCGSNKESIKTNSVKELLTSMVLMLRLLICSICWIFCIFLYNGLTINSVQLSGNSYLDFILTAFVEIPGAIVAFLLADRVGRKMTLVSGFLVSGLSCIASIFIPADLYWLMLVTYLLGKFGISINISVIYTITSEIFPTPFRNSLLSVCSMFGRIGAVVATQTPLLATIWKPLALALFGSVGILASFLTLLLPESMNTKLPNTIQEAIDIGKTTKNHKTSKNVC